MASETLWNAVCSVSVLPLISAASSLVSDSRTALIADSSSKEEIEAAIKAVRESLTSDDAAEINAKTETLHTAFHKVSEAMYQRAQEQAAAGSTDGGPNGAGAETNGAATEEDVVDAEVVDEK